MATSTTAADRTRGQRDQRRPTRPLIQSKPEQGRAEAARRLNYQPHLALAVPACSASHCLTDETNTEEETEGGLASPLPHYQNNDNDHNNNFFAGGWTGVGCGGNVVLSLVKRFY